MFVFASVLLNAYGFGEVVEGVVEEAQSVKETLTEKWKPNEQGNVSTGGQRNNNNQDDWVRYSGQTGRGQSKGGNHTPRTLKEQLAMQEAISNPANGKRGVLNDDRWKTTDGWVKMFQNIEGYEVHYVYNINTGEVDDVKIK